MNQNVNSGHAEENRPIVTDKPAIAFRPEGNDETWRGLDELIAEMERYWNEVGIDDLYMIPDAAELWGWF